MTTAAGASKSKDLYESLPSVEQCRKLFKAKEYDYTDEELLQLRDFLYKLTRIYYEFYMQDFRHRVPVVNLNNATHGTEESHSLRPRKYRRAS
ncbi:hypothetical protein [Flaviaesturariibacter amylovorans]|uniref:Four helix bundle protein n=1 Tax=Flaviaesturariibacter amylovorans TaxID=1084520 RepID=A0ABP8HIB2_9BACT